jgi:hypothetical protein
MGPMGPTGTTPPATGAGSSPAAAPATSVGEGSKRVH